jgi:hypothetical protein
MDPKELFKRLEAIREMDGDHEAQHGEYDTLVCDWLLSIQTNLRITSKMIQDGADQLVRFNHAHRKNWSWA